MVRVVWDPKFKALRTQVERSVIAQIEKAIVNGVGKQSHCSVHDKDAVVNVSGKGLDSLEFQVAGCCDDLIAKVESRLGEL